MREPIDHLLEGRRQRLARRRLPGLLVSVAGHALLTIGVVLAPALAARQRVPPEFVAVQIVPLQALGVPEPVTPPRREPPPAPVKAPAKSPAAAEKATPSPPDPTPAPREPQPDERGTAPTPPVERAQRRGSPFGSPLATSPFGTAVAGFDNPDFVYGYYVDQMLAMIGSNWIRPPVENDVEMTIHFRIHQDGRLSDIEILQPSGFASFDLAGLRAVRLASPLPPLPTSFPHPTLGVRLIIR